MARPPYTVAFIEHVLAIIEPIEDMRYMVRDLDAAIREFIRKLTFEKEGGKCSISLTRKSWQKTHLFLTNH